MEDQFDCIEDEDEFDDIHAMREALMPLVGDALEREEERYATELRDNIALTALSQLLPLQIASYADCARAAGTGFDARALVQATADVCYDLADAMVARRATVKDLSE